MAQSAIPPQQVSWWQSGISASNAQNQLAYKLYVFEESGKTYAVDLLNTLCGRVEDRVECSAALPTAANAAIVTNNTSQLSAINKATKLESPLSGPFTGNQGCIFRDNLYKIGQRISVGANKNNIDATLSQFQAAKFKLIRVITNPNGNYTVREECVGYLVQMTMEDQLANQEPGDK